MNYHFLMFNGFLNKFLFLSSEKPFAFMSFRVLSFRVQGIELAIYEPRKKFQACSASILSAS